jgi:hypothetical protein
MEPNGWAVVHLAANFTATARPDVQSGVLLGLPAEVRFTPQAFSWDYGDGSTRRSADGGTTWLRLGVPEFTPTATSHVYETRGTFTVRIGVVYGAEYRFGGQAWQHITGSLNVAAPSFDVVVGDAKTVLVGGDCTTDPTGPGC